MTALNRSHPLRIATWMRACDRELFAARFAEWPAVQLSDARREPVDLDAADALLLTGGTDIAAEFLRQPVERPDFIESPDRARDAWEFAAVARAVGREIPVLGVCRGCQVLNVALGGTLHLHVDGHRTRSQRDREVQKLRNAGRAAFQFAAVNSSHHQAIDRRAESLDVEAWCAADDVVEQVRHRTLPWCIGVQYHPERGPQYRAVFAAFVDAIEVAARRSGASRVVRKSIDSNVR